MGESGDINPNKVSVPGSVKHSSNNQLYCRRIVDETEGLHLEWRVNGPDKE